MSLFHYFLFFFFPICFLYFPNIWLMIFISTYVHDKCWSTISSSHGIHQGLLLGLPWPHKMNWAMLPTPLFPEIVKDVNYCVFLNYEMYLNTSAVGMHCTTIEYHKGIFFVIPQMLSCHEIDRHKMVVKCIIHL